MNLHLRRTLIGVAIVVVSGAWALDGAIYSWERSIARWLYDVPATGVLRTVQEAGARSAILIVGGLLAVVGRRKAAVTVLVAGFLTWAASTGGKALVDRSRPTLDILARELRSGLENPGYPSTHTAVATMLAVVLIGALRPSRWIAAALLAVAALTAVARIHLGAHWPLDVIGGAGIGLAIGSLAVLAYTAVPPPRTSSRR